jgi:AraC-like DNA-binding protein/TPR repeat protein
MKILLLSILFLFSTELFSQNNKELTHAEYLNLEEKSRMLLNNNVDSSFIYAEIIEKSDNYLHKSFSSALKSYIYQLRGANLQSDKFYQKSISYLEKNSNSREKTRITSLIENYAGLISWKRHDLKKAYDDFTKGRILSNQIGDKKQIIIFNNNISLIQNEVGNYQKAITTLHESEKILFNLEYLYSKDKFTTTVSNIYLQLGLSYENTYYDEKSKYKLLDSALFYYKKTIVFSKNLLDNKLTAQSNMANIYKVKKDFAKAEKIYISLMEFTKENKHENKYFNVAYNLGDLYYEQKKYDKALICFLKVDSIYKSNPINELEYINSNYYQARIYDIYNNPDKALTYSKLYLSNYEKYESEMSDGQKEVNYSLQNIKFKKGMSDIQMKYRYVKIVNYSIIGMVVLLIFLLVFFLIKNIKEKKLINNKVELFIKEFEAMKEQQSSKLKIVNPISIDAVKENEIIHKLELLEKKLFYLTNDFTLQNTAKKIKTNTTYLSFVVNKHYNKTFSEYSNELKINHAINELITNPVFCKYSTQAIAESVGFKNAVSFTKSFSKRVGVSPTQFIKGLTTERNSTT